MIIVSHETPPHCFVDVDFLEFVRFIVRSWNDFNNPFHTLAHALNLKFYNEGIIS